LGMSGFSLPLPQHAKHPKELTIKLEIEKPMLLPKIDVLGDEKKFKDKEKKNKESEPRVEQKEALSEKNSAQKTQEEVKVTDPSREEMLRYQDMVKERIQEARRYPEWARRQKLEGVAELAFTVLSRGACLDVALTSSSGSSILDEEAVQTISRAGPFPRFPQELRRTSLRMRVTIVFLLER